MERRRKNPEGLRLGVILLLGLLLLLAAGPGSAGAEGTGKTVTGYFVDHTYLRPKMIQTTDNVGVIPPYTVVTLDVIDDTWSVFTTPEGKTGYVKYTRILPVPEYEKEKERYVYSERKVEVRTLPVYEAPTVYTAAGYELLTADGSLGGYMHVVAEDGTGGYVLPSWVRIAEFTPEPISPVSLVVAEETPLLDMPLQGAHRMGSLGTDRFYRAEKAYGDYYALELDGEIRYVEKNRTAVCAYRGGESRVFFTFPRAGRQKRKDLTETVFAGAAVRPEGAHLLWADGSTARTLKGDERIYVYSGYGDWYGASFGTAAGYIRRSEVQVLTGEAILERMKSQDLSGGSIERSELLDLAFSMVERGNPFQARYKLLTGSDTESLLPLGIPYFWGGRSYRTVVERLPEYTTREAWQSSPVFYQKGTIYLYGFDCIGFVKAVYSLAGREIEGTVVGRRADPYCLAGEHIYCDDVHPLPEDWREAARTMQVGDIMVIHHPGTHAMMYMGTLRQYGYTEEQLPALADYLDYPLMLQAGENPYCYLRFQSLISASPDRRTAGASPTDGGVCVCILGVPREKAELTLSCHGENYRCFDVEGSCVTIMGFGNVRDYFVYRMGAASLEVAEEEANPEEMDATEAAGDEYAPETAEPGDEAAEPRPEDAAEPEDGEAGEHPETAEPETAGTPEEGTIPEAPEEAGPDPAGTGLQLDNTGSENL